VLNRQVLFFFETIALCYHGAECKKQDGSNKNDVPFSWLGASIELHGKNFSSGTQRYS